MSIVPTQRAKVQIRWLIRRELERVVQIESESFRCPYDRDWFLENLRQVNTVASVAATSHEPDSVCGYMMYHLHKSYIELIDFAVAPESRRQGIGTELIGRLIDKLSRQRRSSIQTLIPDDNLDAHLFFRSCGFGASQIFRDCFESDDGSRMDGYLFRYDL